MTQSHSGVHAQLDALLSAHPQAMFAELVRAGLQALIEAEAATKISADRYERSEVRTTHWQIVLVGTPSLAIRYSDSDDSVLLRVVCSR